MPVEIQQQRNHASAGLDVGARRMDLASSLRCIATLLLLLLLTLTPVSAQDTGGGSANDANTNGASTTGGDTKSDGQQVDPNPSDTGPPDAEKVDQQRPTTESPTPEEPTAEPPASPSGETSTGDNAAGEDAAAEVAGDADTNADATSADATTKDPVDVSAKLTPEYIQSRVDQLAKDSTVSDADRTQLNSVYEQILAELNSTTVLRGERTTWAGKTEAIPEKTQEVELQLSELGDGSEEPPANGEGLTQKELDAKVTSLRSELKETRDTIQTYSPQPQERDDRRLAVPGEAAKLDEYRLTLEKKKAEPSDPDDSTAMREANQLLVNAKLLNNRLRAQLLKDELSYYDASERLLELRLDVAKKKAARQSARLDAWSRIANDRRRAAAEKDQQEKADKARKATEALKPIAQKNVEYSQDLNNLVRDISKSSATLRSTTELLDRWTDQYEQVSKLIDAHAGVTESVGNLLRAQRSELPDANRLENEIRVRTNLIYEIRSAEFTASEELQRLSNLDRYIASEFASLSQERSISARDRRVLKPQLRALLEDRITTLNSLVENYQTYLTSLVKLNVAQDNLRLKSKSYAKFIDERVLWIRSVRPVAWEDFRALPKAVAWLANADLRAALWPTNLKFKTKTLVLHIFIGSLVIASFFVHRIGRERIQKFGERASARGCRDFSITLGTTGWTLLISFTGSALFGWLGWMIRDLTDPARSKATLPVQEALFAAALIYWPLSLWWNATRPQGLVHAHFDRSEMFLAKLRRQLKWLLSTLVPTGAVYYFFSAHHSLTWDTSIARFALVFAASCLAIWCYTLLSPRNGVIREFLFYHSTGWLNRLRYFWFPAAVGLPVVLAILALMGYQYTAQRLLECLFTSTVYLSMLYLLGAIAMRWILINRRELTMAQAKERMAQQREEGGEGGEFQTRGNEQVNVVEIDHQTRKLLHSFTWIAAAIGVYLIWIDVLPALERLNQYRLWEKDVVAAQVLDPGNAAATSEVAKSVSDGSWVTLGSLLGSILILIMMWIAIRNIPGLLEFAVLQKLPFDASIRFAITTVVRYVIIIVGVAGALGNIGFGWSKIQWLAAAVSVGLGFGLQEIFANFISGLILLFERPLRAGDIVTVGDVTGTVIEIKTRATTIQNWDRKELVVPNKEFITGRLLNWTLTDEINRIVIEVGVAYGTDINEARSLVLETVRSHEEILDDPGPTVVFDLFGDSALNLTLRCYLADMSNRLTVIHELHRDIYEALNEAGIEIPFPQRDVHLRTSNGS